LARTYFDEIYTLIIEWNFRPDMDLYARISLPIQKIHLTAIFPPSIKDFYEERQLLLNPRPTYIRASSNRVNIQYIIKIIADKDFFPNLIHFINEKIPILTSDEKILIFCKTIEVIDIIVDLLNIFIYHSKESDKESNLRRWIEGERDIMIIIGILGVGINIKGIKWVIHIEETWGCIPLIQESGRGGREDGTFNSYTILSNEIKNRLEIRDRRSMTPDQLVL
jgi:superfamily II DNA helicase RecQ